MTDLDERPHEGITSRLADYTTAVQFDDIPPGVLGQLKLHLLDAIGAALYGAEQPWSQILRKVVTSWAGDTQATVWSTRTKVPVSHAAFLNSAATHGFELDDRRIASYMHPASATLPAALAVAEARGGATGRDLLTAIFAGYEVGLRIGMAVGKGAFERGFYPPGLGGAFSAVVTASRMWGLSKQTLIHALNLAATQASGLYSPTMIKRFNLGRGTYNGVFAAELAQAGFSGVEDVLESEFGGFCAAFADDADLTLLDKGLGHDFESTRVELKPYVSSRPNHTAIDCVLLLRRQHPEIVVDAIDEIEIDVGTANYRYGAGFEVTSVPAALMSVAYCAAVALADGQAFLEQFNDRRVRSKDVQDLIHRTRVSINEEFDQLGLEERDMTTVRVRLNDGNVFESTRAFAKGHPTSPMSEVEVRRKFEQLVDGLVDSDRAERIQTCLLDLESLEDSNYLNRLLASNGDPHSA